MTASVGAHYFIFPPIGSVGGKIAMHDSILGAIPVIFAGKGTPTEDIEPFLSAPKGSLYMMLDQADNSESLWVKVDDANAGDDTDWYGVTISAA